MGGEEKFEGRAPYNARVRTHIQAMTKDGSRVTSGSVGLGKRGTRE